MPCKTPEFLAHSHFCGSSIERESLAPFKRKKLARLFSLIQRNTFKALSMDYCCTVGLPTLLLYNKLLAQYFEKEIYIEMCVFHRKPFFVKPRGFLHLTAKTQEKVSWFKEIQTLQYKHAQIWVTNSFDLVFHWLSGITDALPYLRF